MSSFSFVDDATFGDPGLGDETVELEAGDHEVPAPIAEVTTDAPALEELDVLRLADEYGAARPGFDRAKAWAQRSEAEQQALRSIGVGPIDVPVPEESSIVRPDHPEFTQTMNLAAATVQAGWTAIQAGNLDLTPETAERLRALVDAANLAPPDHPMHFGAMQNAAAIIDQAQEAKAAGQPFGRVKRRESGGEMPDGSFYDIETNYRGQSRRVVYSPEQVIEAATLMSDQPAWGDTPESVTIEQAAGWSPVEWAAYERTNPKLAAQLWEHLALMANDGTMKDAS